jgi:hypothetical protein
LDSESGDDERKEAKGTCDRRVCVPFAKQFDSVGLA